MRPPPSGASGAAYGGACGAGYGAAGGGAFAVCAQGAPLGAVPEEVDPLFGGQREREREAARRRWQGRAPAEKGLPQACLAVALTFALPWGAFLLTSLFFMVMYHNLPALALLLAELGLVACLAVAAQGLVQGNADKAYAFTACGLGVALGAAAGGYDYCVHWRDYWDFMDYRRYNNVSASALADAHRDASVVLFQDGVAPDQRMPMAYAARSHTYCVAPVTASSAGAETPTAPVQFWAVGLDCCNQGGFACGGARSPAAHGGLVLRNRTYFFHAVVSRDYDLYAEAISMAVAKFGITSAPAPVLLRWALDLEAARAAQLRAAWFGWLGAGFASVFLWLSVATFAPGLQRNFDANARRGSPGKRPPARAPPPCLGWQRNELL